VDRQAESAASVENDPQETLRGSELLPRKITIEPYFAGRISLL
jgi:hypothetical protein